MPVIRNSFLIKRFTDFFKLKTNDFLDSEAGRMLVPVITEPIPVNIRQLISINLNDSDKRFDVPSGKQWKLLYGQAVFTTTATAGTRFIRIEFTDDGGNVLYTSVQINGQVASTTETYNFSNFGNAAESTTSIHELPIPDKSILSENFRIRIRDEPAVDATADDLLIRLIVEEIDVTGE